MELRIGADVLRHRRKVTFNRFAGINESFDLAHHFSEPTKAGIDSVHYLLELRSSRGGRMRGMVGFPLLSFHQKTSLIFPIRGAFVVTNGDVTEGGHHERSQQYAYDIVGIGENMEWLRGSGAKNEDLVGWGREVISPGDGVVAYSRNDVPDNAAPGVIDMTRLQALPEPMWALAGNVMVIDHGNGEFSVFGHMQQGSVRVRTGERVRKGQVVGLLGNSGHSQGPHLHYHLMDGPILYRQDGLPSRFDNIEGGVPVQGTPTEAK